MPSTHYEIALTSLDNGIAILNRCYYNLLTNPWTMYNLIDEEDLECSYSSLNLFQNNLFFHFSKNEKILKWSSLIVDGVSILQQCVKTIYTLTRVKLLKEGQ